MGTLDDFFEMADTKDEATHLGGRILRNLTAMGYGFTDAREVLAGEETAPAELQSDIARYAVLKAKVAQFQAAADEHRRLEQKTAEEARKRIEAGNYSNADLEIVYQAGLARRCYADPQSNRPTHIEWTRPGDPYADQAGIEENPLGRR